MQTGLILEDHPRASAWLEASLVAAFPGIAVRTTDTVTSACAAISDWTPEIALIDLGLPDGDGLDVIRLLAPRGSRCVVTTVFADDAHVFPALQAGACGYVLKDQSRAELTGMLIGIVAGQPPLSPSIATRLLAHFAAPPAAPDAPHLAPREREILELIAKGHSVPRVAEALGITYHTAAGYVKQVYQKLNVSSRAEAALEATRLGLVR